MITNKRWKYVILGLLCMLCFGASYAWGVFVIPLEQQYGLLRSSTSFAFTLNVLIFAIGIFIAGWLTAFISFSSVLKIGALVMGAGFVLMAFAASMPTIYFSFSFMCGMGSGICYNGVISSIPQWFPDKSGLVTGILLVGYALSTAIFGPLCQWLVESYGLSATFTILGVVCGSLLLLLSQGLKIPDEHQLILLPQKKQFEGQRARRNIPPGFMLRKPVFWLAFLCLAFISGMGLIVINHIAPLLTEELSINPATASFILSGIFICNATGRIGSGWLLDKAGFNITFITIAAFMLFSMALLLYGLEIKSPPMVIIASSFALFTFGSNASMIPNSVRFLFGQKYFPINYSLINTNIIIVSFMPTLAGVI